MIRSFLSRESYKLLPTDVLTTDATNGVLANDGNPDQADLTVQLVKDVDHGTLSLNADGSFTFDAQGIAGTTTFTYRINDGTGLSAETTAHAAGQYSSGVDGRSV